MSRFHRSIAVVPLALALALAACTQQADRMPGAALPQTTDGDPAAVVVTDTAAIDAGALVSDTAALDAGAAISDTADLAAPLDAADVLTSTDVLTGSGDAAGIDAANPGIGKLDPPSCPTLSTATGQPGWVLASSPGVTTAKTPVVVTPNSGWKAMTGASWISSDSQLGSGKIGDFVFTYSFCLCDYPKAGAPAPVLTLNVRSDNASTVFVNNTLIGGASATSFSAAAPTTLTYNGSYGGGWKPGTNVLRIVVHNDSLVAGLIASLSVTRAAPGPCARCLLDTGTGKAGWTVSGGPSNFAPKAPVKVTPIAAWLPVAKAEWVSTNATLIDSAGVYNYDVTLCLCDPPAAGTAAAASLTLTFRSDNDAKVFLNGKQIGSANNANFKAAAPTTITVNSGWQPGANKLRIEVTNTGSETGLAAALAGTGLRVGPCPEFKLYATSGNSILKFAMDGTLPAAPTVLANEPTSQNYGITFGPEGYLYVSDFAQNRVLRYHPGTGAALPSAGNTGAVFVKSQAGGLSTPHGLAFNPTGTHLHVGSIGTTSGILRYLPGKGTFVNNLVGTAKVYGRAVTFGPNGVLYATSDKDVVRYDAAGKALGVFATDPNAMTHYDVAVGPNGSVYVTASETNSVLRYDAAGKAQPAPGKTGATFANGLNKPYGLVFDADGRLYVANTVAGEILRYDTTTGTSTMFATGLANPMYLAVGP